MRIGDAGENKCRQLSKAQIVIVVSVFVVCVIGAINIHPNFCPDESGRQLLTQWIYENRALPSGEEVGIVMPGWGFSYALRPYLSAIINTVFMWIFTVFGQTGRLLLLASRMCSVLSVTGCCLFGMKLGNILFAKRTSALLFSVVSTFLPQVMFLGMYQNNDSLSLFGVFLVLYYFVAGYKSKWSIRNCIGMAIGVSIVLLSYYSVYGWLFVIGLGFIVLCLANKETRAIFVKRSVLIICIVLALSGWFFVRNALIHDGDFLGLATEEKDRMNLISEGEVLYQYNRPSEIEGNTIINELKKGQYFWLKASLKSFIGVFGYMNIYLNKGQYYFYYVIFLLAALSYGILLIHCRSSLKQYWLFIILLISGAITFFLSVWQTYYRDYQAQGRYFISLIIFISYMLAYAIDNSNKLFDEKKERQINKSIDIINCFIAIVWIGMFAWIFIGTMLPQMTA